MIKDQNEKNRKLTEAEQRRLAHYEALSADYIAQGYKRTELTVGIVAANIFALMFGLPLVIAGIILFHIVHPGEMLLRLSFPEFVLFIVLMFVLVVGHELIHGVTWSIFAAQHFRDIEFGFMKEYLTPYCTCKCPLSRGKYIVGALMPLIVLGLLPMIMGITLGWKLWMLLGMIMTISAGGDILIVINILKYKSSCNEIVYIDHPTQAGGVIFER